MVKMPTFLIVVLLIGILVTITILVSVPIIVLIARKHFHKQRLKHQKNVTVAFFHPYCNAGGGGERVLWCAVQALQNKYSQIKIYVYTGDIDASPQEILYKAGDRFNIRLSHVEFIYLHKRCWVEPNKYPYFTLLGQSIGSLVLGYEALKTLVPNIYIDTMGYAFTLPLFSFLGGCETVSYVHYPTITPDMMETVSSRRSTLTNRSFIARNPALSAVKLAYYRLFAALYRSCGKFSTCVMVNSSWTEDHINALWRLPQFTHKVYPPCDTKDLESIPLMRNTNNKIKILSVSQFRKEKNHPLQLQSMYSLRQIVPENLWERIELTLIGATRNKEDEEWLQDLKDLAKHLSIEDNVNFKINVSYETLKKELAEGLIGVHTMTNEHFGIGIVECMAAGLIMIAHRSGGPMMDIIEECDTSRNGYLALDENEYARAIAIALSLPEKKRSAIQDAARSSAHRFSVAEFQKNFLRVVKPLINC